jgi:acyl dehydratase
MSARKELMHGFYWDELQIGDSFSTQKRTITETDLVTFCNLNWFTEDLFVDLSNREALAISGRVVPGALVYSFAEGLIVPSIQNTGLAFLETSMSVKGPTFVGDTLHVEVEVIELKSTSKPERGLIRTRNRVFNQKGIVTLEYNPLRLLKRKI